MSRTRNFIVVTVSAAAGLFLGALATSATAAADTAANPAPGLPGLMEQLVTTPAAIPQQILQSTTAMLTGAPATPATPPLANATINLPQTVPGGAPAAPAGLPGVTGIPGSGDLSRFLPFPMPSLGTTPTAPAAAAPGLIAPTAVGTVPSAIAPALTFPISALP